MYPYNAPGLLLREADLAVIRHREHLNGYCAFPLGELPAEWAGDYNAPGLQLLAISGGITYAEVGEGLAVFGFDCNHADDSERPELQDPAYVLQLAAQMREQLIAFAARWDEFLAATPEAKLRILDEVRAEATLPTEYGLGGLIIFMAGADWLEPIP